MNKQLNVPVNKCQPANGSQQNALLVNSSHHESCGETSKIIHPLDASEIRANGDNFFFNGKEPQNVQESCVNHLQKKSDPVHALPAQNTGSLFRLFVKNGEYVYARPNDIIMIESCDHMVKVYLGFNDKIKKVIRHNTLKDFLLQLPQEQFIRIGRFCAVNIHRLSGGNCNEQTFEFDFRVSVKLKHSISHTAFYSIGK